MTIGAANPGPRARALRRSGEDRRRELAEVAATHFHRLGFHRVSLAAVATDVGVTAPAVYRHFRNKNALLAGAVATGLDHVEAALERSGSLDGALDRLAEAALARRDVWVLLQREIRHLDDQDRVAATARFRGLVRTFAGHVRAARPDLDDGQLQIVTTAAFAVLASPSTQPVVLTLDAYRDALANAARSVCRADLPEPGSGGTARHASLTDVALPRREQLLRTAISLFHQHGYAAVSMDDIGATVGIAGPSIYHHFATKAELLLGAYDHASALIPVPAPRTEQPAHDLLRRYAATVVGERELFGVYVTEAINLPDNSRRSVSDAVRADIERWVSVLQAERRDLTPTHAELLVHAARSIVHDITRIGRLHTRPAVVEEIVALAGALLASPGYRMVLTTG